MNKLMESRLDSERNDTTDLAVEIAKGTRNIYDCLVYDKEGEIDEERLEFDRIISIYGDRTGYEVACNEIRIDKFSRAQIDSLLIELDRKLTEKFSRKVVIYIQELENSLELRFHSFREDEKLWLSENLEEYDIPILCHIS